MQMYYSETGCLPIFDKTPWIFDELPAVETAVLQIQKFKSQGSKKKSPKG